MTKPRVEQVQDHIAKVTSAGQAVADAAVKAAETAVAARDEATPPTTPGKAGTP